ncbi:MAG: Fe-S cluster assembly protein SufD [Cyanobacteria bacterium P01_A01_bin.135]
MTSAAPVKRRDLRGLLALRSPLVTPDLERSRWLNDLRDDAMTALSERLLPTTREEEWRFTDIKALVDLPLRSPQVSTVAAEALERYRIPDAPKLVFVDGRYVPELSSDAEIDGITVGPLLSWHGPDLTPYLGQQQGLERTFAGLNAASFIDAAVIWVDPKAVIEQPVHLLYVSTTDDAALTHPRALVVAGAHSQLTLVEDFVAIGEGAYVTNSVTEIYLAENAGLTHLRLQRDSSEAYHFGKTAVSQQRDSRYAGHFISLGSKLSRHNPEVFQQGPQTETALNGLTIATGQQLADTHSLIRYDHPHGSSSQLHKCIVGDRAHGVFNGKVLVPQAAQMTDAGQLNRNLMLSPKARIDTKPQLEIVADNVKCTHGATVSQLDPAELFYLRSRGIDAARAQTLLVRAFAGEIIDALPIEAVRSQMVVCVAALAP